MAAAGRPANVGADVGRLALAMIEDRPDTSSIGDLRALFHRLNNQLGVILAHAELLEAKAHDEANRARAAHVVGATLEAMTVTRVLRDQISSSLERQSA